MPIRFEVSDRIKWSGGFTRFNRECVVNSQVGRPWRSRHSVDSDNLRRSKARQGFNQSSARQDLKSQKIPSPEGYQKLAGGNTPGDWTYEMIRPGGAKEMAEATRRRVVFPQPLPGRMNVRRFYRGYYPRLISPNPPGWLHLVLEAPARKRRTRS